MAAILRTHIDEWKDETIQHVKVLSRKNICRAGSGFYPSTVSPTEPSSLYAGINTESFKLKPPEKISLYLHMTGFLEK
jgi:hypothetical protein